ncbi:MAG: molybdenum cofactor guanylyltransferase [Bacteroidetes bacterium]|nr:molybdenum cofactor guanylyltransferase [Bacteroidota bacterium]
MVLAGGESRRMGQDKALITIHGKPAFFHAAELLKNFCETVFVLCRENQDLMSHLAEQPTWLTEVFDNNEYSDKGPLTGLLSYLAHSGIDHKQKLPAETPCEGLLVLGCDYRNMSQETLENVVAVGQMQSRICCYQNHITQFLEPLVAYYPISDLMQLRDFAIENSSLQQFVQTHNPCILPTDSQRILTLRSFDQ